MIALSLGIIVVGESQADGPTGPCTDMDRDCIQEVVATYINAQADSSLRDKIRVAPDVVRWENGVRNADGADEIRSGQTDDDSGFTGLLGASDVERIFIDTQFKQAVVYWLMDVKDPVTGTQLSTAHIAERFLLTNDCGGEISPCIAEIEAIFCVGQGDEEPMPEEQSGDGILCFRQSP